MGLIYMSRVWFWSMDYEFEYEYGFQAWFKFELVLKIIL